MMTIKTYFLFPDTDEDFIRLGENPQTYRDLIRTIAIIKEQLKNHKPFELCYDSENVKAFISKVKSLMEQSYWSKWEYQLHTLFGNHTRNIQTNSLKNKACLYVHWNIALGFAYAGEIIAEATEAKLHEGTDKTIVVSIAEAYTNNRDAIHIIKDTAPRNNSDTPDNDLPVLVTIPMVHHEIAFSYWLNTLATPDFSLSDKTKFQRTNFVYGKQRIYQALDTDYYWYYDFFHDTNKKHFEVYDAQGKHLGEANMNGKLDRTKADATKRITDIISGH